MTPSIRPQLRRACGRVATVLVAVALVAGILAPAAAQAEVGPHGPAKVTCYDSGRILLEPRYDKIRNLDQYLSHIFQIYSYATGKWYTLGDWRTYHVLPGHTFMYGSVRPEFYNVTPGQYYVYTTYRWWSQGRVIGEVGDYTGSYGFAQGDGVVGYTNRCYTYPAFTVSGVGGSDYCRDFQLCARATRSASGAERLQETSQLRHGKRPPPPPKLRVPLTPR